MTVTPHSIVVICAAEERSGLLAIGDAMGVAGGMDVPLSGTGKEPVTHYGARSWSTSAFVEIMTGRLIPTLSGVTPDQLKAALAGVIVDVVIDAVTQPTFSARGHFESVCQSMGLQTVETSIE